MKKIFQLNVFVIFATLNCIALAAPKDTRYSMDCAFYGKKGVLDRVIFNIERLTGEFWTGSFSQTVTVVKADGSIVKTPASLKIVGTQDAIFKNDMDGYHAEMKIKNPDVGVAEVYQSEFLRNHLYFERHLRSDRIRTAEELKMPHAQHQQHMLSEPKAAQGIAFFCSPRRL